MSAPTLHPDFDASLRLLVERERYSLTDIGLMFGVSRERARQWCEKRGITYPEGTVRGLNAVRIWDDAANRFQPVRRQAIARAKRQAASAQRRAIRAARCAAKQAEIIRVVTDLRASLNRPPTWYEMWVAIGGDPLVRQESCAARVLSRFGMGRVVSIRERLKAFRRATGIESRPSGSPGHVGDGRKRRVACNKCHGPLHTKPSGYRYCKPCEKKRARNRRSRLSVSKSASDIPRMTHPPTAAHGSTPEMTENEKCPICHNGEVGVVIESRAFAWGEFPAVTIEDRRSRCGECGEEWYDAEQANRHFSALLKATLNVTAAALAARDEELKAAQQLCNRWIEAALKLDPPSGGALAFDPMNPEAFAHSRTPYILALVEESKARRDQVWSAYRAGFLEGSNQTGIDSYERAVIEAEAHAREYCDARKMPRASRAEDDASAATPPASAPSVVTGSMDLTHRAVTGTPTVANPSPVTQEMIAAALAVADDFEGHLSPIRQVAARQVFRMLDAAFRTQTTALLAERSSGQETATSPTRIDDDKLRGVLEELCAKAFPEVVDEEGGLSEMVGDYLAAIRIGRPSGARETTPSEQTPSEGWVCMSGQCHTLHRTSDGSLVAHRPYLGGCTCATRAPSVPVARSPRTHLDDCPAKNSGYLVGQVSGPAASGARETTPSERRCGKCGTNLPDWCSDCLRTRLAEVLKDIEAQRKGRKPT